MTARAFLTSTPSADTHALRKANAKHVPIENIVILQSSCKYTDAVDRDGTTYLLDDCKENTIKALAAEYGDAFVEVRRGCLVRRSEIRSVSGNGSDTLVVLKCDMRVPVSRRNKGMVRKLVAEHRERLKPYAEIVEDNTDFENNILDVTVEIRYG